MSVAELKTVEYERRGSVGVWTITDFASFYTSGEIEAGERHYRETASQAEMTGTVVVIENAEALGSDLRESLDRINEQWSRLGEAVEVDRLAYVADGMMSSAVTANLEVDVELASFENVEEAVSWAGREAQI